MLSTATCGRRTTCTTAALTPASIPATAGVTTVPAGYNSVPARTSSPAPRSESPACTTFEMATCAPPSTRSVSSTITIASAPAGMGAPVMMRMASPGWSTRSV